MGQYMRLVTRWSQAEIDALEAGMRANTLHPRDAKMKLAHEIVSIYHGEEAASRAQEAFVRVFQQKDVPDEMPEYQLKAGQSVLQVLLDGKLVASNSEGRRMIEQNGVRLDGETLSDANQPLPHPGVLQVGKRRFIRVIS
jgi:tyrosyl-tRNA synthetase